MIKQVKVDPRIRLDAKSLESAIGSPPVCNVNRFDDETISKLTESFGVAHSISQEVIPVIINSYGGSAYHLMAIISLFKQSKIPIATIVEGTAMSAGAILFAMGSVGYRFMAPDATLMIHDIGSFTGGKVEEIKSDANQIDKLNHNIYEMMAIHCEKDKDYFMNLIHEKGHADWFLDINDALEHNICDKSNIPLFTVEIGVKYSLK